MFSVPDPPDLTTVLALVPGLPLEVLAEAVAGEGPFVFDVDPWTGETRFNCPECRYRDHNLPSARVVDGTLWSCDRCGARRTRWFVERLIREDASLLERLAHLLSEREAA